MPRGRSSRIDGGRGRLVFFDQKEAIMPLAAEERDRLIQRYADGPAKLRAAIAAVPAEAMQWRPAPGEVSVPQLACHCAHSETNAAARHRHLGAGGHTP